MGAVESKQLPQGLKDMGEFVQEDIEGYRTAFDNGGLSELKKKVDEDIEKWERVPVNIDVTGNSGAGKSSFINGFREVRAKQEGAAAVGVNETTEETMKYIYPKNENIALWDLPGVGTQKFPKATYLGDMDFKKYDYVIIITATRFTENDLWLANEIQNLGKSFFFVRTKMDIDVLNDKHDNPGVCRSETVNKIRKSTAIHVETGNIKDAKVYVVNSRSVKEYDFPILIDDMVQQAPKLKQEAMTFSMSNLTEDLIKRKRDALRKRIMKVSLGSAAVGAVPIPGISLAVDSGILMKEYQFYRKQFGLDDESLHENATALDMSVESLKSAVKITSYLLGTSAKSTLAFAGSVVVSEVAERVTAIAIPLIGNAIAAAISYGSTVVVLRSLLDAFVTDASAINKLLMERLSTKTLS